MITIQHILCPSDFSEFSARAFGYATSLARWYGASITALHVYPHVPAPPTELPAHAFRTRLTAELRQQLLEELQRFTAPARGGSVPAEFVLVEGDPVGEILRLERTSATDLTVLGTHGRGGFQRWVLGSVAEKVLRRAAAPVLTVPPRAAGREDEVPALFRHILCPVDFSEPSLRAVEFALSLCREANARITLLHVTEVLPEGVPAEVPGFPLDGYHRHLGEIARERLQGMIPAGAREWLDPEVLVATGKPYRRILEAAAERSSDLIVMGVQGRNPLDLMLFGSTTQHVVRQAACPVLTVRQH